jgi:FAD-linked sulfhydryl oxidase
MPLSGWNPLSPVLHTVAAFSRHLLIAPDAGPDDHRLRPLLSLSLSLPPTPPPPQPEVLKARRFSSVLGRLLSFSVLVEGMVTCK